MKYMQRLIGFLRRILTGSDVILIQQTKEEWNNQFAKGRWNRLAEGQPNTHILAELLLRDATTRPISVLDVGCGNGGLARLIAQQPSITYCGIDISDVAIKSAQITVPGARFVVADATKPPTDLGVFDWIIFNEVLYYADPLIVLPQYKVYAANKAQLGFSVITFWRSWFIWRRIRVHVQIKRKFIVQDGSRTWRVAVGEYQ